jgi:hypothetical protein
MRIAIPLPVSPALTACGGGNGDGEDPVEETDAFSLDGKGLPFSVASSWAGLR